eukprot:TRINITY_DN28935_c0_g1_i2.p1 TRINITY_DN28935_c0_g1~~TRINITY_DN28935_c0_g1_i2.p1  ORF type:complete len:505 (+),score=64.13 TRINITY_DN28935_c0_g1_i2:58-1515(+)
MTPSLPPVLAKDVVDVAGVEDESVRDLRRALSETMPPKIKRTLSDSAILAERDDGLLHPEFGRLRDVAQPGGFRRHHVRQVNVNDGATESTYASSILVQLLSPTIMLSFLDLGENDDAMLLDEQDARLSRTKSSNTSTAVCITKVFFSSFMLMVPGGYRNSGLLGGAGALLFVVSLCIFAMVLLIDCRINTGPGYGYSDLARFLGGEWGHKFLLTTIMAAQVGFCCIWTLVIGQNLAILFPDIGVEVLLWVSLPVTIPLVWVRHLRFYTVTNLIAIVIQDFLLWPGACAYGFEGVNGLLPIYEAAQDKNSVKRLFIFVTGSILLFYAFFGTVFYLAFGDATEDMVTKNIPDGSPWQYLLPAGMVFVGLFSNPLNYFVLFATFEKQINWSTKPCTRKVQKNICRAGWALLLTTITWAGGNQLQNFLGLVGGLCCSTLALIVPALLHMVICKPKAVWVVVDLIMLIVGVAILLSSTTESILTWGNKK